jgi:hypothetical protein
MDIFNEPKFKKIKKVNNENKIKFDIEAKKTFLIFLII